MRRSINEVVGSTAANTLDQLRERDREPDRRNRDRDREEELDAIKEQYLGGNKPKKRVKRPLRPGEFGFSYDREKTKDTSRDMNSLYQKTSTSVWYSGRGFRGSMKLNSHDSFGKRVDRHWSDKRLEEMTESDWRIFRKDFNISYSGWRIPRPIRSWEESKLSSELLKAVERFRYEKPSPIQRAVIPLGLHQRDFLGIAETGFGKIAAFVLPMLAYISRLPPMSEENETEGPYAVVMAPTQKLADQIREQTAEFALDLGFRVTSFVEQGLKITKGCEIVITTPDRLIDCLERRNAVLNQCSYVVLDEVDRMIEMGFEAQVAGVLDAMPSSNLKPENEDEEPDEKKIYRTTHMFSTTMHIPAGVERLARRYLRDPVVVTIGTAGLISQQVIMMKEPEKFSWLQRLLDERRGHKTVIVFANTKKNVESIAKNLYKGGYSVATLHGKTPIEQREISLEGLRSKRYNVLVAKDVVGINIPDVDHVINYDMPEHIEMYTHRIEHIFPHRPRRYTDRIWVSL